MSQTKSPVRRYIFFAATVLIVAALLLQSYLAFHKQVYIGCKLSVEQGLIVPDPLRATCIQVGGYDK